MCAGIGYNRAMGNPENAGPFLESRRDGRRPLQSSVRLGWINDDKQMEYISGRMIDISSNGMALQTPKRVRLTALVHVDITDRHVAAIGRVRSCVRFENGWRSGIELIADAVQHT